MCRPDGCIDIDGEETSQTIGSESFTIITVKGSIIRSTFSKSGQCYPTFNRMSIVSSFI